MRFCERFEFDARDFKIEAAADRVLLHRGQRPRTRWQRRQGVRKREIEIAAPKTQRFASRSRSLAAHWRALASWVVRSA
jgi:hypothetical protein